MRTACISSMPRILSMTRQKQLFPDYYESNDASTLTHKIRSIPAFKTILSPMRGECDGYIPDLSSRYFTEDFECGTFYIRDTARLKGVDTPVIDRVCEWYESLKAYK